MVNAKNDGCCRTLCNYCPLSKHNNNTNIGCMRLEMLYPQKAIKIVQEWSNEHPQKTYLSEFLKHYPNAQLDSDGVPDGICLATLGLCEDCIKMDENGNPILEKDCTCMDCWNTPIEE